MRLAGKRGLIVGLANGQSIAAGCAAACTREGAEVVMTCRNEAALQWAQPAGREAGADTVLPMDVIRPDQVDSVFAGLERRWGGLDFLIHSIAWCNREDLHGRIVDSSAAGFAEAMDVSCHSFLRLARKAEPLMKKGGSLLTMSFAGSRQVVPQYGLMGPVKAALEASVKYMAVELGPAGIRVNALSPGPIATRAAGGLAGFDRLMASTGKAPLQPAAGIADVGAWAAFLVSYEARAVTGATIDTDSGLSVMSGMSHE